MLKRSLEYTSDDFQALPYCDGFQHAYGNPLGIRKVGAYQSRTWYRYIPPSLSSQLLFVEQRNHARAHPDCRDYYPVVRV
jgi:hypothetical protein